MTEAEFDTAVQRSRGGCNNVKITHHAYERAVQRFRLDVPDLDEAGFRRWLFGIVAQALGHGTEQVLRDGSLRVYHNGRFFIFGMCKEGDRPKLITAGRGSAKRDRAHRNDNKFRPGKLPPGFGRHSRGAKRAKTIRRYPEERIPPR